MEKQEKLQLELEWYEIRDALIVNENITKALNMAMKCNHPDAQWLVQVFAGKNVSTIEEAQSVFLLLTHDSRAFCFAALLNSTNTLHELLRKSAEMGYAFAQSKMIHTSEQEYADWTRKAALQRERDAMYRFGIIFNNQDPRRWKWWGRAALKGRRFFFLSKFAKIVTLHFDEYGYEAAMFSIGKQLSRIGGFDERNQTIFGVKIAYTDYSYHAEHAIKFYKDQCTTARMAVDTWLLIARRIGCALINKDMRRKIGLLIWSGRKLANYKQIPLVMVRQDVKRTRICIY